MSQLFPSAMFGALRWRRSVAESDAADANDAAGSPDTVSPSGNGVLWVDSAGGFQLLVGDRFHIGSVAGIPNVDIAIRADLQRDAAAIRRSEGDYLINIREPKGATETALLSDGQPWRLRSVELMLDKPSPLSATARLSIQTRHRFEPNVDAVLLVSDSVLVGPGDACHIVVPHATTTVVLTPPRRNPESGTFTGSWMFRPLNLPDAPPQRLQAAKSHRIADVTMTLQPLGVN